MIQRLSHFAKDQNGTAAIEFALVLPFLLTLTIGMFEIAGVISADMKLANTAQLIGDLVAQQSAGETNTLTSNFCTGGGMALAPLPTAPLRTAVASVTHKAAGRSVDWQDTTCGGPTISNATTLAASLTPNVGDSVIIVVSTYTYTSPVTYVLRATYTLTQTSFSRPRNVPNITHS